MKKGIGRLGVFFSFFIVFALVSGVITFAITFNKERANKEGAEQLMTQVTKDNKKTTAIKNIKETLEGAEDVYLESYLGSSDIVEMNDQDAGAIFARLKSLNLKFLKADDMEHHDFLYAIHIKSKNIKIKVNNQYVMIEDVQQGTQIFQVLKQDVEDLNIALEEIYMKKYNTHELFKNPKTIYVTAMDEEKQWGLGKEEIKEFLKNASLISPVGGEELVGIPHIYPDYIIKIVMEHKDYKLHLINKEILMLDTPDSHTYYRYDSKLWDYITKEYPVKLNAQWGTFKYLLKSEKAMVDDLNDVYDFEDNTYYHMEIPRCLIRAEKKEIEKVSDYEKLMFVLSFTVDRKITEVKIYENHISYGGKNYYSEKIAETVKSILSAP